MVSHQSKPKISLCKSINEKCKDCIYDPLSGLGTWREQVAQCTVLDRPLWLIRPGPRSGEYQRPSIDEEVRRYVNSANPLAGNGKDKRVAYTICSCTR